MLDAPANLAPSVQVEDSTVLHRRAMRRAAWRLIPLLALAYFFNYLDRTSVGYAALQMTGSLGLTAAQFGFGAGIMFVGYGLCEVPSNLAMYRFGAPLWMARIMITWGLVAATTAFVIGPYSFYTVRFLLGIAEAGFFPSVFFAHAVVSRSLSHSGAGLVHLGHAYLFPGRRSSLHLVAADALYLGFGWMAVDVYHRRSTSLRIR